MTFSPERRETAEVIKRLEEDMTRKSLIASLSSVFVIASSLVLALPTPAYAAAHLSASDRDHDGMSNRWEVRFHLNPRHANAFSDADRDGLTNVAEFRLGLNPRDKDTDNDGLFDGLEDRDHDGIDNEDEDVNECGIGGEGDEDECFAGAFASDDEDDD